QQQADTADAIHIKVEGQPSQQQSAEPGPHAQGKPHTSSPLATLTLSSSSAPGLRPSVAALLCGFEIQHPPQHVVRMSDYTAQAHYQPREDQLPAYPLGMPAAAQVFAQESFFDESCVLQGRDPVQARLDAIDNATGHDL